MYLVNKIKKKSIVFVDEIDGLLGSNQSVLYSLFSWVAQNNSTLLLIGIANHIHLTEKFLPRLRARDCEPQLLIFNPYSGPQLTAILEERLQQYKEVCFFLICINKSKEREGQQQQKKTKRPTHWSCYFFFKRKMMVNCNSLRRTPSSLSPSRFFFSNTLFFIKTLTKNWFAAFLPKGNNPPQKKIVGSHLSLSLSHTHTNNTPPHTHTRSL